MATARTTLKIAAMMGALLAVVAGAALYLGEPVTIEVVGVDTWQCRLQFAMLPITCVPKR